MFDCQRACGRPLVPCPFVTILIPCRDEEGWAILPYAYSDALRLSLRRLTPTLFIGSVGIGLLLSGVSIHARWLTALVVAVYGVGCLAASLQQADRARDLRMVCLLPALFVTLHVTYGVGGLFGAVKVAAVFSSRAVAARTVQEVPH